MVRTIFLLVTLPFLLVACAEETETAVQTPSTTEPQAATSPPPGSAWVSYLPQAGPVGTRVHIQGNVGQALLDSNSTFKMVSVRLLKLDSPPLPYRAGLAKIPYNEVGEFEGDVIIPEYLGPWQGPADASPHQVGVGAYQLQVHPVDVGLLVFDVTGD